MDHAWQPDAWRRLDEPFWSGNSRMGDTEVFADAAFDVP